MEEGEGLQHRAMEEAAAAEEAAWQDLNESRARWLKFRGLRCAALRLLWRCKQMSVGSSAGSQALRAIDGPAAASASLNTKYGCPRSVAGELQRLGDDEDVDAGMAEAKARRWRFVIRLTSPAQSRGEGQSRQRDPLF